ncbi:unnamed protein product [Peronospora belbahrii]|uniref:non-specific serine/threonine protein kinase n=1 Tax=Peronospora belbahrii TaxID=622444 RepID=A0AAU9L5R5_9STRA|nr:unnamed protein product [Peronospora belbahrii]CAH0521130.1 unnamed protein product [Peronospora belbahrii]
MHSTFAFGLAKNGVNGLPNVRRAATVSHISGRLSTPTSPVITECSNSGGGSSSYEEDIVTALPGSFTMIPHVATVPIAFVEQRIEDDPDADAASVTMAVCEMGDDLQVRKRGTSVDKTNPFIGYFQTGIEEVDAEVLEVKTMDTSMLATPPVPIRRMPCRTQSSAALSSMSSFCRSAFLTPQKKMTEWLGSQGSRFPPLFKQQDVKQHEEMKHNVLLQSLKLETPALTARVRKDERHEKKQQKKTFKRTESLPAAMSATLAATTLSTIVTSSSEMKISSIGLRNENSCTPNSRFEQDFEIIGSLGEGGQGLVYKVRSKVDGCYYAVKKVVLPRASKLDDRCVENQALREVRSMASMAPHPNVVRYHTAWTEMDAYVPHTSSSTESVRGSDVLSRLESSYGMHDFQRQQLALLDEEAELHWSNMKSADQSFFFLESSVDSLFDEYSIPGFTFEYEDEDNDSVGWCVDNETFVGQPGVLENKVIRATGRTAESAAIKAQVVLYIQMELCGTAMHIASSSLAAADNHEPVHCILDKFKTPQQERQYFGEETHSNLGAWFRSSLQERLLWSNTSDIHQEGLKLFFGAVQGVAHMHSHGVIHRDLKPDNIFIHGDVAKIGDFGLSKSIFADNSIGDGVVSPRERLEELGLSDGDHTTALGTFTYASPEQLGYRFGSSSALKNAATRLKSAKYSIKSDIFALGVILLELCCPFSTMMERSQVLTGVRHGVVPQKARQHFPMEMDLVLRMTSIDPSERPTSEEVCEQLRKIIAASSTAITPASVLEDLRELQIKLAAAVRLVRDRPQQATLQLEALVSELNDKVKNVSIAFV